MDRVAIASLFDGARLLLNERADPGPGARVVIQVSNHVRSSKTRSSINDDVVLWMKVTRVSKE